METPVVQPVQEMAKSVSKNKVWPYVVGAFAVVIVGVVSAWLISSKVVNKGGGATPNMEVTSAGAGVLDSDVKYDTAIGELNDGGIAGQGTHHLVRDGGPSQNVYLTSSVIDLSSFVGKKIKVWGQTLASKKVSWLMDVSKVEVVQ